MQRIFIVGAPRSGTTLLQTLLAAAPRLLSLPETHVLRLGIGRRGAQLLAPARRKGILTELHRELSLSERAPGSSPALVSANGLVRRMVEALDDCARAGGFERWIEKTPEHVFYIDDISSNCPDAKFIHMLRDGRPTTASIVDMWAAYTKDYSTSRNVFMSVSDSASVAKALATSLGNLRRPRLTDTWAHRRFVRAAMLWNDSITVSRRFQGHSSHLICHYEKLAQDPESELKRICSFLDLPFSREMLSAQSRANQVVRASETWKSGNFGPVRPATDQKFARLPPAIQSLVTSLLTAGGDAHAALHARGASRS